MKLLSIAVPSYNSQDYLDRCIATLLPGGDEVEILIVDDGSKDRTAEIADEYEKKYPGIVRAIHQPNKGHGGAVNTGLAAATGLYFRVVDSDDWLDFDAYAIALATLRTLHAQHNDVDLFLSNYVYEKEGKKHKRVIQFEGVLPEDRVFTWDEIGHFKLGQYLLMHTMIYRTELLRSTGLQLPEHCFYVDNIFCYVPLQYVQKLYYKNIDLYRYYIGRDDQSINEKVMIKRIDQQLKVNRLMVTSMDFKAIPNRKQAKTIYNYLEIITAVSNLLLLIMDSDESLRLHDELWDFIRQHDAKLYRRLRFGVYGLMLHLPGRAGRKISLDTYSLAQKVFGFN